ncbi:hypothetical protein [Cardinium endosymbiont of Oedothorax gibbosus]|uniref:hypothetical protein n=1 Tax=Cardinium endosymbiont of Oedothorax gibbosus TaxID=931101 RepID=UPI00202546D0|nr:hypothetical protein [Cardinium endosymbiont of Oedothorax gibbosus]CAH2559885.1 hypothetical protein CAOEGIBSW744_0424 [Cardinium endosymbiont of Oedothorax gibbosus]
MNEQIRLAKNIVETFKPFQSLVQNLEKAKNSLEEGCRVELEGNVPQPIFQELVKASQEAFIIAQDFIHPEDHISLSELQSVREYSTCLYEKMQAVFLECLPEEQQAYQAHLAHLLSLSQSMVENTRTLKQIMPNSLIRELQDLKKEVQKQAAAISGDSKAHHKT